MTYISNPKLEGSNIVGCVPQDTKCPCKCKDCGNCERFYRETKRRLGL